MIEMASSFELDKNSLSSSIPTELGDLKKLTGDFYLTFNSLCGHVPTEIQALSSSEVTGWAVIQGNYINQKCDPRDHAFFMTMASILILTVSGKRILDSPGGATLGLCTMGSTK